jgi:branched-chain amino acid transport system ATP-binding protein
MANSSTSRDLLEVENVTIRFGGVVANNKVSLICPEGKVTAVLGPNGAGKSTLFDLVTGRRKPDSGVIRWLGRNITHLADFDRALLGIARTYQNLAVVPTMSVLENVAIGASRFRNYGFLGCLARGPRARQNDRALEAVANRAISAVGLRSLKDRPASWLSYADLRRLELARALLLAPRMLLLDEPAAGMDPSETEQLGDALLTIRDKWEITIVVVEHDLELVGKIADVAYVLDFGNVLAGGSLAEVMTNEKVVAAYLGENSRREVVADVMMGR